MQIALVLIFSHYMFIRRHRQHVVVEDRSVTPV